EDAKPPDASEKNKTSSTAANAFSTETATARQAASPSAQAVSPPLGAAEAPQAAAPAAASPSASASPSKAAQESFGRALRKEETVPDIVSADTRSRWRIIAGGAVQRSTDSGSTWETQVTGVSVT